MTLSHVGLPAMADYVPINSVVNLEVVLVGSRSGDKTETKLTFNLCLIFICRSRGI